MKVFGKNIFNFKNFLPKPEPGTMYDFYTWINYNTAPLNYYPVEELIQEIDINGRPVKKKAKKKVKEEKKIYVTPKGLYEMKALNDNKFFIKTEKEYLDKNIDDAEYKLEIMYGGKPKKKKKLRAGEPMSDEPYGARYGKLELESIIERLKNRYKIDEFKNILEEYPHTTNELLQQVIHKDSGLCCKKAESFVPDFPRDAIEAMKKYNDMCVKLCNKKSVFYVVANAKDFQQVSKRRDPILLAQSPFGFFWQILGAWDETMIYLGDL